MYNQRVAGGFQNINISIHTEESYKTRRYLKECRVLREEIVKIKGEYIQVCNQKT